MASWPAIITAIEDWTRKGAALGDDAVVELINTAQDFPGDTFALIEIAEIAPIGEDTVVLETPEDESSYEKVEGQRSIRLRIKFHCFDQTPEHFAVLYAERLRAASNAQALIDLLDAADLAVISINSTTTEDIEVDDRLISVAVLDVVLSAVVCISLRTEGVLSDADELQTIAHVEVTSEIENEGGDLLPPSAQMSAEMIPPVPEPEP